MRRMGELAMENLLKLMSGEKSTVAIRIPAERIVRESTGRPKGVGSPTGSQGAWESGSQGVKEPGVGSRESRTE
jgi:hypothetical protein